MDKKLMDAYIDEFIENYEKNGKYNAPMKVDGVKKLFSKDKPNGFKNQTAYENPEYLEYNFCRSVQPIKRNKDAAIEVYRRFHQFLQSKGISAEVTFPPIPVSNSFERLMFIAKYFHEPNRKISDLPNILWVDPKTIKNDIKKLTGEDKDPLQVCKRKFKIPAVDSNNKDTLVFESTAHPLFLTSNVTQLIAMLKGLRQMSEDPLFGDAAKITAANIWEQLSNYAKKRVPEVMRNLLLEDITWYENLKTPDNSHFYTERVLSTDINKMFYTTKNMIPFCVEARDGNEKHIYTNCRLLHQSGPDNYTIQSDQGEITLNKNEITQIAYSIDGLH